MARDLVRNAADPEQLKYAERHNRRREEQERGDLRAALQHPPTRRLLMRILYEARCDLAHAIEEHPEVTASTYDPGAKIHYHNGRRDLGLLVQGWIRMADPKALIEMLAEQLAGQQRNDREVDAVHATAHAATERTDG